MTECLFLYPPNEVRLFPAERWLFCNHHQVGLNWAEIMYQAVSLDSIFVWFVWGFFMAMGWVLGSWAMNRLFGLMKVKV